MFEKKLRRREVIRSAIITGSFLAGSFAIGCSQKKPPSAPSTEVIKIGLLAPLSGPFSIFGKPFMQGAQMAVEEINSKGILPGTVEIVIRDTKFNPSESSTAFEELVYEEKVISVIGPVSSDVGLATSKKAEKLKIPLLLHLSGSDKILTKNSRYTFRTAELPPPQLMKGFADYIKAKGYTRIGAIVADYAWGHSVKQSIETYIATIPGIKVQIEVAPVRESDFTSYLRKIQDLNPEFIIANGHPPGTAKIVKQGLDLGLKAKYIGAGDKKMWETVLGDRVLEGVLDYKPVDYNSEFLKIGEKYYGIYNEEMDREAATGYVNIYHLAWAVGKAKSTDPVKIADTIREGYYKHPIFAYPFSYTEWGDLKEPRIVIVSFKPGPPPGNMNPKATTHYEVEYVTQTLPPVEPPE